MWSAQQHQWSRIRKQEWYSKLRGDRRAAKDITVVEGRVNASLLSGATDRTLQKDMNDDRRALGSSYKTRSLVVKGVSESATCNAEDKVIEITQQKHVSQVCTPQESAVKSEERTNKSSETLASTVTLPSNESDEKDQSQEVRYKIADMSITEKPVHTVFQETVSRGTKCEENIQ